MPEFHLEICDQHGVIAPGRGAVIGEVSDALARADQLARELVDSNRNNPHRPKSYAVKIMDELRQPILTVVVRG